MFEREYLIHPVSAAYFLSSLANFWRCQKEVVRNYCWDAVDELKIERRRDDGNKNWRNYLLCWECEALNEKRERRNKQAQPPTISPNRVFFWFITHHFEKSLCFISSFFSLFFADTKSSKKSKESLGFQIDCCSTKKSIQKISFDFKIFCDLSFWWLFTADDGFSYLVIL